MSVFARFNASVCLALIVSIVVPVSAHAQLANGSFEQDDASSGDLTCATDWTCFNEAYTTAALSLPRTGSQVLKTFGPFTTAGAGTGAEQVLPATPGERWSGRVFALNWSGDPLQGNDVGFLRVTFVDNLGSPVSGDTPGLDRFDSIAMDASTTQDTWIALDVNTAPAPAGTAFARVSLLKIAVDGFNGGSLFWDDVSLSQGFTDVTPAAMSAVGNSVGMAFLDYDSDAQVDMVLLSPTGQHALLRGDGSSFVLEPAAPLATGQPEDRVTAADYDADGDDDLLLTSSTGPGGLLLRNDSGIFVDVTPSWLASAGAVRSHAWFDADEDGDLEIYLTRDAGNLYYVLGDAGYVDATVPPLGQGGTAALVLAADVDGDQDRDLLLIDRSGPARLLKNSAGSFVSQTVSGLDGEYRVASVADFDDDGDLDVAVAPVTGGVVLLRSSALGTYAPVVLPTVGTGTELVDGLTWVDLDNDGDRDLLVTGAAIGDGYLLRNAGGAFALFELPVPLGTAPVELAVGDVDRDGGQELVVLRASGSPLLLRGDPPAYADWFALDLRGRGGTDEGAIVRTLAGSEEWFQRVGHSSTGAALSSTIVHQGLGALAAVDSVQILWPDGLVQDLAAVPSSGTTTAITRSTPLGVTATDGTREDVTLIEWVAEANEDYSHRVLRNGLLLTELASGVDTFADTTGDPDQVYTYTVLQIDVGGDLLGTGSDTGFRSIFEPTAVSASDSTFVDGVRVEWSDNSTLEVGFRIFRAESPGGPVELATVDRNFEVYDDTTAVAGVTYDYSVVAYDDLGFESDLGPATTDAGTRGFVLPALGLLASDGIYTDRVDLSWQTQEDPGREGFRVYRRPATGGAATLLASLNRVAAAYSDTLDLGQAWNYEVRAHRPMASLVANRGDDTVLKKVDYESAPVSDDGIGGPDTMAPPTAVTATVDARDDAVALSWADAGPDETGYRVLRDGQLVATLGEDTVAYVDENAPVGSPLQYCIQAEHAEGGTSDPAAACAQGSRSPVVAPFDVLASDGSDEDLVELSWKSSSTTAVLFRVYRDGTLIKTLPATTTSTTDDAIDTQPHVYEVAAVTGPGVESARVADTGYRTLEEASDVAASDSAFEEKVRVTWRDNSLVETGYILYRELADSTGLGEEIGRAAANRSVLEDATGVPGFSYRYTVVAFDDRGGRSAGTDDDAADLGQRVLVAARNVEATDGEFEDRVRITWGDESRVETGYAIYRSPAGLGSWSSVGLVATDVRAYEDTTVAAGADYDFLVKTVDALGESPLAFDALADNADQGLAALFAPAWVNASTVYDDRVVLTWDDRSQSETGYRVYRDGTLVATLSANVASWVDTSGPLEAEYCVATIVDTGSEVLETEQFCTMGRRSGVSAFIGAGIPAAVPFAESIDNDLFGFSIDIQGDRLVVGSPTQVPSAGNPQALVYSRQGCDGAWQLDHQLISGPRAGYSVALANDGNDWVLVGDAEFDEGNGGSVRGFELGPAPGGTLTNLSFVGAPSGLADPGIAVAADGNLGAYSSEDRGYFDDFIFEYVFDGPATVVVFEKVGTSLVVDTTFTAPGYTTPNSSPSNFGKDVAISGQTLAISSNVGGFSGRVYLWEKDGLGPNNGWSNVLDDRPADADAGFGSDIDLNGNFFVVATPDRGPSIYPEDSGTVHVYEQKTPGNWVLSAVLTNPTGSGRGFARRVAIDGENILVEMQGQLLIYRLQPWGEWRWISSHAGAQVNGGLALEGGSVAFGNVSDSPGTGAPGDAGGAYAGPSIVDVGEVKATQNSPEAVTITWDAANSCVSTYRIRRDGELIGETTSTQFVDALADNGQVYEYCVNGVEDGRELPGGCDFGGRAANGVISGRVTSFAGAGVESVTVCLDPPPSNSLLLDGQDGIVLLEDYSLPAEEFTLETWVKTSSSDPATLFQYSVFDSPQPIVELFDPGNLKVRMFGTIQTAGVGIDLSDGVWHHLVVTWSTAAGQVEIYVDGVRRSYPSGFPQTPLPGPGRAALGNDLSTNLYGEPSTPGLAGQLDEIRLWSIRLDQDQIVDRASVRLVGDEPGLYGYWPIEQSRGGGALDRTANDRSAQLGPGVYWTEQGAPSIQVCVTTDQQGGYTLDRLRYGESTTFRVIPSGEGRRFQPDFKSITLSAGNPIENEINFVETTSFTVSGLVEYRSTEFNCTTPGVTILVDGLPKAVAGADGRYELSLTPGDYTLVPTLEGHTFDPPFIELTVDADRAGVDFDDTTLRTLSGQVGGGCDAQIGTVILSVLSENGCVEKQVVTTGPFELKLPPQKYFVVVEDVANVPAPLDEAAIYQFFQDLGTQEADLTTADVDLEFIYRAPLRIKVSGLPDIDPDCVANGGFDLPGGGKGAPAPVLAQEERVELTIEVFEDYGNGNLCPAESGTVTIYDEVLDEEDEPVVLQVVDGFAMVETDTGRVPYETAGNEPFLFNGRLDENDNDRSFQKFISFVAEVDGQDPVVAKQWVLVTGRKTRDAFFVTVADNLPLLILRDPPGDASYSTVREEETFCTTIFAKLLGSVAFGAEFNAELGFKFEKGFGVTTETEGQISSNGWFVTTLTSSISDELQFCATATEDFSTSSSDAFVGPDANVYMGIGLNIAFAKADAIELENGCTVVETEKVSYEPREIETVYSYTQGYIRDTLIPELQSLGKTYEVASWRNILDINDELRRDAEVKDARSFSAGADFTATETNSTTNTFTWQLGVRTDGGQSQTLGFKESGFGASATFFNEFAVELSGGLSLEAGESRTVAYTLSDDDPGDSFSIEVGEDDTYGTPVFKVLNGRSSCPWEPWSFQGGPNNTQSRDLPEMGVQGPTTQIGVPADEPAVFQLSLRNDSPSNEIRDYVLWVDQTTNRYGAQLGLNGDPLAAGYLMRLEPGVDHEVTFTIGRGPLRYRYDDLKLLLTPACTYEAAVQNRIDLQEDPLTAQIDLSVQFDAPCTDVVFDFPRPNWSFNAVDADTSGGLIKLRAKDFLFELGPDVTSDKELQSITFEYRRLGTQDWLPATDPIPADQISVDPVTGVPQSVTRYWDVGQDESGVPDGEYELRAVARCQAGPAYSNVSVGRIDRKAPLVVRAEPADLELSLGDPISIRYDEIIDCQRLADVEVDIDNLSDPTVEIIPELVCDGDNGVILISRTTPSLDSLEDDLLEVRVSGARDAAGNAAASHAWQFTVQRSQFTWERATYAADAPFGDPSSFVVNLVNGTTQGQSFQLEPAGGGPLPDWLELTPPAGTIRPEEVLPIVFTTTFDQPGDVGRSEILLLDAVLLNDQGTPILSTQLALDLSVVCAPPSFTLDAGAYQYSMTLVAELSVGGQTSVDSSDVLVAFVGNQVRGVASPELVNGSLWRVFLTIYGAIPAGETIRFEVWDDSDCILYPGTNPPTLSFVSDDRVGAILNPQLIETRELPNVGGLTIAMIDGWNWFSLNLVADDMTVPTVLGSLNPSADDVVKAQFGEFAQFSPEVGWVGTLEAFDNIQSYALKISDQGSILLQGDPVLPSVTPIPIGGGWNWIAYNAAAAQNLNSALLNLEAGGNLTAEDQVKDRIGFAEFDPLAGWLGSLTEMVPGVGYRLFLDQPVDTSFTYPQASAMPVLAASGELSTLPHDRSELSRRAKHARREKLAQLAKAAPPTNEGYRGSPWQFNPRAFEHSMTITAVLDLPVGVEVTENQVVAALVDGEVRGLTAPVWVEGLREYRVFLMAHAPVVAGDELRFALYDPETEEVLEGPTSVVFESDETVGGVDDPTRIELALGESTVLPSSFALRGNYPNPLTGSGGSTMIRFALPRTERVKITLYDSRGRRVRSLLDEVREPGVHDLPFQAAGLSNGVYHYRMQAGSFVQVRKMVVVR